MRYKFGNIFHLCSWKIGIENSRTEILMSKRLESVRIFIYLLFLNEISSAQQGCIYLINNIVKNCNIVKYYSLKELFSIYIVKYNWFLWCKAEFSASLLQSTVSHDPSEIILICWFAAQGTFLIIINGENNCAASYFVQTVIHFYLGFFDQ